MGLPSAPFRSDPPDRQAEVLRQASRYDPAVWKAAVPDAVRCWPDVLDTLPTSSRSTETRTLRLVSRSDVFSLAAEASEPWSALSAYVVVAAWGAGMSARGRVRSLRSLTSAAAVGKLEAVGRNLMEAADLARSGSVVAAYAALHGRGPDEGGLRVTHLGPAYGTKVLYFAAYENRADGLPALILDSRVATGLGWLTKTEWPTDGWTSGEYRAYLELAVHWAYLWGSEPDIVERVLFAIGKSEELAVKSLTD
jgi:hypothetical protein